MAATVGESARSPFENVFQILPQGHDKALKQAFYNTAATLFAVFVCGAAVAVYYILEAFLRPLLWAVLCGTFLHPFKNTLTSIVTGWFASLRESGTPLFIGTVLLPVKLIDGASETVGTAIYNQWKLIVAVGLGLPCVYLLYYFGPVQQILLVFKAMFVFVYDALGYFSAIWVWSLVVAYTMVVVFFWKPESERVLRFLALPVWVALMFHLTTVAGALRVPLVIVILALMIVGFVAEMNAARQKQLDQEEVEVPPSPAALGEQKEWSDESEEKSEKPKSEGKDLPTATSISEKDELDSSTFAKVESSTADIPDSRGNQERPLLLDMSSQRLARASPSRLPPSKKEKSLVDHCFIALFWGIVLVQIWIHFWVVQLLPVLVVILILKKLGVQLGSWHFLREKVKYFAKKVHKALEDDARIDILAPKPIRGIGKLVIRGDRKIVAVLESSMDKFMSILIILLLIVGSVIISFFAVVQVHRESMHLVSVTSNVLNNSLHPELSQWLPDGEDMQKALDSMADNAYIYGREWIASKVNSAFNGDVDSKHVMEKQVLEIWDRFYESWFARNSTSPAVSHPGLQRQLSIQNLSSLSSVWEVASDFKLDIVAFVQENIGMVMSVLESVWAVLKGNISLLISVLTSSISLVLGGGTAILNLVISLAVFLTTLFYLLATSGDQYKPVEWFVSISPTQGGSSNRFGQAVEEAIGSVFAASLKMSAFYGLYTWMIHTAFGINIVFIPSALAAIFAGIPFLGTHWAALPAVIELWLVNGQSVQAIMLLVCQLLPTYVVDTAIYSEIKGGHPYLTGLSIAGGMYWLGLEGAIIGPILLCCLIVAVTVYSTMLKPEPSTSASAAGRRHRVSGLATEKKVTFSFKRAFSEDFS